MKSKMTVRGKLILILLLASSIPLVTFAGISFYFSQRSAVDNAISDNLKNVKQVQTKVDNLINDNLNGVKTIAKVSSVRAFDVENTKPLLVEALKVYNNVSNFTVTKANGDQLIRSDASKLANLADRSYFQEVMKGKEEVVSEVLESKNTGELITVLSTPIKDKDGGNVIGTFQGTIGLNSLNNFVKELSKDNIKVYIVDKEGKMLADPTKSYTTLADRPDLSKYDFVKSGLSGKDGSEQFNKDGTKELISYIHDQKTGWLICAEIPKSIAIQDSVRQAIITLLIGLGILIITCVSVAMLGEFGFTPIQLLNIKKNK